MKHDLYNRRRYKQPNHSLIAHNFTPVKERRKGGGGELLMLQENNFEQFQTIKR